MSILTILTWLQDKLEQILVRMLTLYYGDTYYIQYSHRYRARRRSENGAGLEGGFRFCAMTRGA